MRTGSCVGLRPLAALASVAAVLAGGCTVVLSENAPPRIIVTPPRVVRSVVVVPAVTGHAYEAAETILAENQLGVGEIGYRQSNLPAGTVIDQVPNAGAVVHGGGDVKLTLAIAQAQARVPSVVGKGLVAASISLRLAGLRPGNVTYRSVPGVVSSQVSAQSHMAGSLVPLGTSVDLVINNPSPKVSVPGLAGKTYAHALRDLRGSGLRVTGISNRNHPVIQKGHVVSHSPSAGALVDPGTGVSVVLSAGSGRVAVPHVTGKTLATAIAELARSGLQPIVEHKPLVGIPGRVASQVPGMGTMVDRGTVVNLVVIKALPAVVIVTVPDLRGKLPGEATTLLMAAGLTSGTTTHGPGMPGRIVSQVPAAGTRAKRGTAVSLVIGRIVTPSAIRVVVPSVVGMQEATATAALRRSGLTVGTVTKAVGVRPGAVLRQLPSAGSRVARGSSVDITVAERRVVTLQVTVPNVVGMQEGSAGAALRRLGLQVGNVTKAAGPVPGRVLTQSPSANARVARGSKVNITVAERRVVTRKVTVPNVVGMQEGSAGAALRRLGLLAGTVTKAAGPVPGRVLNQSPSAGASVPRGTRVALTVAVKTAVGPTPPPAPGAQLVAVPNVVGLSLGQAKKALKNAGLDVGRISRKRIPGAKRGRIAEQDPKAASKVVKGTKVNLVFSF